MGLARAWRVAVLAAMVPELQPVVRALALEPLALGGARAYQGRCGERAVVAAVTTMGTRAAREVTARLLDAYDVQHVVVVGICGGIDRRRRIGDLVVPEVVLDEASGVAYRPTALGGAAPRATLLTTDVLHTDPATLAGLARRGVAAVDMESAAIGAISESRGIPWSVFRAISDWAGDPDVDDELMRMSHPDGTANPRAVLRYVFTHPGRIPKLARLGRGMRLAVQSSTAAALAALRAQGAVGDSSAANSMTPGVPSAEL